MSKAKGIFEDEAKGENPSQIGNKTLEEHSVETDVMASNNASREVTKMLGNINLNSQPKKMEFPPYEYEKRHEWFEVIEQIFADHGITNSLDKCLLIRPSLDIESIILAIKIPFKRDLYVEVKETLLRERPNRNIKKF